MALKDEIMWAVSGTGEDFQCVHVDFAREQQAEIERLRAANEHNEKAVHSCNQKISELELWNREYREQIAFWKAKAEKSADPGQTSRD